jgi:NADPH:quinone reductase-like Zn-dependent oxidoreductase
MTAPLDDAPAPGDLPRAMRVVEIAEPGGPEVLKPARRPPPAPGHGEILIKVAAAGVNRPDALQRAGAYDPPKGASDLPGLEVSGEVVALGPEAHRWCVGDRVCALTPGGGYAEYVTAPEGHALPWPERLSAEEAAALPETFFTVWTNVFDRAALRPGRRRCSIHGGSSGIGTTAIQLASRLRRRACSAPSGPRRRRRRARGSGRSARSTTARRISSRSCGPPPAVAARTSFSTWLAATTSRAMCGRRPTAAGSCSSPFFTARRLR